MAWTLEYGGIEQSLADWGLEEGLSLRRANQAADVLRCRRAMSATAVATFAYGWEVIVRRDRTYDEELDEWTGGSIWFRGKAAGSGAAGDGSAESQEYLFFGPWWDFERLVMQQEWTGSGGTQRSSELVLGNTITGTSQTTGEVVEEAVAWAASCGVSVQAGTIDEGVSFPHYPCRDWTVAEVIVAMLRWTPDAVTWFDYTTDPPTFYARRLANLSTVTLTLGTDQVEGLALRPRNDLVLPAVALKFKRVNEVSGQQWVEFDEQKYPSSATGTELGALVATIDLIGLRASIVSATIVTEAVAPNSRNWWAKHLQWLGSAEIDTDSIQINDWRIEDENGSVINDWQSTPYELVDGHVAEWMGATTRRVTARARLSYDLYADTAQNIDAERVRGKEISVALTLTDVVSGTYANAAVEEEAEAAPAGLAQGIYESRATLQHEGQIVLVDEEVPETALMGSKVTISGGNAAWTEMLVQEVEEYPHEGRVVIQVGPARQIGIADLIELLRVNRYRLVTGSRTQRITGHPAGSATTTLGQYMPKRDSLGDLGRRELIAAVAEGDKPGERVQVALSGAAGSIGAAVVDEYGQPVEGRGGFTAAIADLEGRSASFRWIYFRDANDGCRMKRHLVFCSEPENVD